jgi:hypothetical protein
MRVWKLEGSPQSAYFAVGVLTLLGGFLTDLVDFGHFWAPFFLFSLFFDFQTRYTRTPEATMYYSPSQTEIEAGRPSASAVKKVIPKQTPKMSPKAKKSKAGVQIMECKMATKVCKLMFPINDMDREWTDDGACRRPLTDR